MKTTPILLLFVLAAFAADPNFVKTTTHCKDASGNDINIVSTFYSDGLGKQIQSKIKIDNSKDRVSCTFYDEAGRPEKTTKAFVDEVSPGVYLSKSFSALMDATTGQLKNQDGYNDDENPFSYTKYSDDPLSRVIEQNGLGEDYTGNPVKTWYFGVAIESTTRPITFPHDGGTATISFTDGFITSAMSDADYDDQLDDLASYLLTNNVFNCTGCTGAQYFLTVNKDPNDKYTQEFKDIFGKTVATKAKPSA